MSGSMCHPGFLIVIPAKAGIQGSIPQPLPIAALDASLRWHDGYHGMGISTSAWVRS